MDKPIGFIKMDIHGNLLVPLDIIDSNGDFEIYPTNNCFNDALDMMEDFIKEEGLDPKKITVCHGICIAPDSTEYAHAWLEIGGDAWERGLIKPDEICQYSASMQEYYKERKVKEVTKYSVKEAAIENYKHGHYGPWLSKYHKLTRNGHLMQERLKAMDDV